MSNEQKPLADLLAMGWEKSAVISQPHPPFSEHPDGLVHTIIYVREGWRIERSWFGPKGEGIGYDNAKVPYELRDDREFWVLAGVQPGWDFPREMRYEGAGYDEVSVQASEALVEGIYRHENTAAALKKALAAIAPDARNTKEDKEKA